VGLIGDPNPYQGTSQCRSQSLGVESKPACLTYLAILPQRHHRHIRRVVGREHTRLHDPELNQDTSRMPH
jgi:hypothetical protein